LSQLTVAVDAGDLARDPRGLGRYARALVRELAQRDDISLVLVVDALLSTLVRKTFEALLKSDRFSLARRIPRSANVAWHPWNRLTLRASLPHVVTIADVAPFRFPHPDPHRREHQQAPFHRAARHAARIITLSHASAADIQAYLGAPPERIAVTYPGVDPVFHPRVENGSLPAERPYFLFVGNVHEERKNFHVLYEAFRRTWGANKGPALLVAGPTDPELPGVEHRAVDDARLAALYANALATCVPARYEGFGLPAIESMACGTPVLASNVSALPEACSDAAVLLAPDDVAAWSFAMERAATQPSLRAEFASRGLQRAAEFRWERCAQQTLEILSQAAYNIP